MSDEGFSGRAARFLARRAVVVGLVARIVAARVLPALLDGTDRDEEHARSRMRALLTQLNYRRKIDRPQLSEWSKLANSSRAMAFNFLSGIDCR